MSPTTPSESPYTYTTPPHRPCTYKPYLHTARLTLEVFDDESATHTEHSLQILNDPASVDAMGDFGIKTPEQPLILSTATMLLPNHMPSGQAPSSTCGYIVRLGADAPSGEMIGLVTLASRSPSVPPDLGWGFKSTHWGKGYATEAATEVMRYLMEELEGGFAHAKPKIGIIAWPTPSNAASVRVCEKIGMVEMGEITGDDGVEVVYGVPALLGDRRFTKEEVVSFYGPGEMGRECKAALFGENGSLTSTPSLV